MTTYEILLRITLVFITLLILARIMGRKEISQMTFFNFISAIAVGSIGANVAVNANLSILNGIIALIGWSMITLIFSFIDIKSRNGRVIITGQPNILIKNGIILEEAMRQSKISLDELTALLRQKNVFTIKDVDYAILEVNGKLSVKKKSTQQSTTKIDLNIPIPSQIYPLATSVIQDGKLLYDNLNQLKIKPQYILDQIKQQGFQSLEEIFYGEIQTDGTLYLNQRTQT